MNGCHWGNGHVEWLRVKFDELARMPIYLRTANELPSIVQTGYALAWTSRTLDLRLRPILEPRGEWAGRGFAVAVESVGDFFSLTFSEQCGILTHEFAHYLESWDDPQRRKDFVWTAENEWLTIPGNVDLVCARLGMEPITVSETRVMHHGAAFTRAALHCWRRCRLEIPLNLMHVFCEQYGSPDTDRAIASLENELRECGSILDTLRKPMPDAFAALWI